MNDLRSATLWMLSDMIELSGSEEERAPRNDIKIPPPLVYTLANSGLPGTIWACDAVESFLSSIRIMAVLEGLDLREPCDPLDDDEPSIVRLRTLRITDSREIFRHRPCNSGRQAAISARFDSIILQKSIRVIKTCG